jgi:Ca2+-binding RTX toxin-like protein
MAIINGTGGDDNLVGTTAADTLNGFAGNDTLNGGASNDTMVGGQGDDVYIVAQAGDVVTELAGEGIDTIQTSVTYTASNNVENLTLTGALSINGTGNALDNVLTGNTGNNTLNGGAGADTLVGGVGNDIYVVDNSGDTITENAGEGTDTIQSSISYTIAANVETLTLTGAGNINATGDAADNRLNGNTGNNLLDGGIGMDTMAGGAGNDTYIVDNAGDVVTEAAGAGTDTIQASITFTLSTNVENLILTGGAAINGSGNGLANTITGNSANNTLNGGTGADTLIGGAGDDTYVVDNAGDVITENAGEGTDLVQSSVTHTLSANVENLTLTGGTAISGTGNALDNIITGNSGVNILNGGDGNDTIDGGLGNDTMAGGTGDDTFIVNAAGDVVTENAGEGTDTVRSATTYTIGANIENLILTGGGNINGTGNAGDNTITGNGGNNILNGSGGNDTLDGGAGTDTMIGGTGNDTFLVDAAGDIVTELAGEGTDTVHSSVTYTLGANLENLTLTGVADINGTGNALDNAITGNAGANTINGGAGADTLAGGGGNDTYVIDDAGDAITENAGEGTDTVHSSVTYTLGANLENLTLTGGTAIDGTGNGENNIITGNNAANIIDGGAGADIMIGGGGNDTYMIDDVADVTAENAGEGTDTVYAAFSYTLGANIENLTLTGAAAINGTGSADDNAITGNSASNIIDGGAGADTMAGGDGDDTYVVDNAGDVITENANEGNDTVQTSSDYTIGANIENLTLTGTGNISGTGNTGNNTITGNSGDNALDGGGGMDTLLGGDGDDTYEINDASDVVIENAGEGTDTVRASISYVVGANIENLILTGTGDIDGTGGAGVNNIIGNSGDNVLDGGTGADIMAGGDGDDTYNVDDAGDITTENANEGTDTVRTAFSYTLGTNIENLILTGADAINGTGNAEDNTLTGNAGANVLAGGLGDDYYIIGEGDSVVELAGSGNDTVEADFDYAMEANIENLILTGTGNFNLTGNTVDNILTGNNGNNIINGLAGADIMAGRGGDDIFYVDNAGDTVIENTGEGTDTVIASLSYTLSAEVENIVLAGASAINATGNAGNNTLTGNSAANVLTGGLGDDTYVVTTNDTIMELAGEGTDTVMAAFTYTLSGNLENITLTGNANINATGNAMDNILTGNGGVNILTGGDGNDAYVVGLKDKVMESAGQGTDTVLSSITWILTANLENLTLTGEDAINGTGNSVDNIITGNIRNNIIDGGLGNDTLIGGEGDDVYRVDAGDIITELVEEGTDTVQSYYDYTLGANLERLVLVGSGYINGTGNDLDNELSGNSRDNILTGGRGNDKLFGYVGRDTLIGGEGDDTYTIDAGDTLIENAGEGIDTVVSAITFTLGANFENLTLTGSSTLKGTGNALDNVITGNASANILTGGLGDDTYVIGAGDTVVELAGEGNDTVKSSAGYIMGANIENLILIGTAGINATGNASDNNMTGNDANNTLNGGAGNDAMTGGMGNDTYVVDSAGDTTIENAGEGTDTVQSSITWTLGANVEHLTLTGAIAIDGTGNALNNTLTGNSAANILTGGDGDDIYVIDAADTVVENAAEGDDTVKASFTYTLGANVENLTLTGTVAINATGNALDNILTGNSAANVLTGGMGDDTYVIGAGDTIVELAGEGIDTVMTTANYTLGANIENLTLTGSAALKGTGNNLDNFITGNSAANVLIGGLGNDTYVIEHKGDVVTEKADEGVDTVLSYRTENLGINIENLTLMGAAAINAIGNVLDNVLIGNAAKNTLDGRTGLDQMYGGAGDDTYVVDNLGDGVYENANEGTDTVQAAISFTLGANLENLVLTGTAIIDATGNALDNIITGNSAANFMMGGAGNDTYFSGAGDTVIELAGEGNDTINSSVTYTLGANLENLILTGTAAINGTGNALDNILTGNAKSNILTGGAGNDTYIVAAGDTVIENAGQGTDTVQSSVTFTLGANVENLTLTGSAALNGTGNAEGNIITGNTGNNTLTGNGGADTLYGGAGTDTLRGGSEDDILYGQGGTDTLYGDAGADRFVFENGTAYIGIDTIRDFSVAQGDVIDIHDLLATYDPLLNDITEFVRIAASGTNSTLSIDRDGAGTGFGWTQIATLTGVTGLTDEAALVTAGNLAV